MKKKFGNLTVIYILGLIITLLSLFLFTGLALDYDPYDDTWIYVLMILAIVLVCIGIDRFCVGKYGVKHVNKVELYLIAGVFLIVLLRKIIVALQLIRS